MRRAKEKAPLSTWEIQDPIPSYAARPVNPERSHAARTYAKGSVLDVGCGAGQYVYLLDDGREILGIDIERFASWDSKPSLFRQTRVEELGAQGHQFDTVLAFEVLEHIPDPVEALREIRKVCRQRLILSVPNCAPPPGMQASNLIFRHWIDRTHVNFFTAEAIRAALESAGFEVEECFLFNKINLTPLILEVFPFLRPIRPILWRLSEWILPNEYKMSIMVRARISGQAG